MRTMNTNRICKKRINHHDVESSVSSFEEMSNPLVEDRDNCQAMFNRKWRNPIARKMVTSKNDCVLLFGFYIAYYTREGNVVKIGKHEN